MSTTAAERAQWTAPGSDASAQTTYASIKEALKTVSSRRSLDIFLQGSYANKTNIRADSDVDVVVMSKAIFFGTPERLSATARLAFEGLGSGTFTPTDLREEVMDALCAYYGVGLVDARNKCITVQGRGSRLDADVVPCVEYHYYDQGAQDLSSYVEGVRIQPLRGSPIINFPKSHRENGRLKNAACLDRYKPTVRQVKRLRNRAIDEGRLGPDEAPGYLLECMVHNVPSSVFIADDAERLWDVAWWLHNATKYAFMSCDGIHTLFGTDPGNFTVQQADRIARALWDAV